MSDKDTEEKPGVQFRKKYLTNHKKSRKFLNELINSARQIKAEGGQVDVPYLRGMCYALKLMLDYYSFEADMKIEERIQVLEKMMEERE